MIQLWSVTGVATVITLYRIARMGNSKNKSRFFNKETLKERRGELEPLTDKDRVLLTYIVAQTNFVCFRHAYICGVFVYSSCSTIAMQ